MDPTDDASTPPTPTGAALDAFVDALVDDLQRLAAGLAARDTELDDATLTHRARDLLDDLLFVALAEAHHIEPPGALAAAMARDTPIAAMRELMTRVLGRYRLPADAWTDEHTPLDAPSLRRVLSGWRERTHDGPVHSDPPAAPAADPSIFGRLHARLLGRVLERRPSGRVEMTEAPDGAHRPDGVVYTPPPIVEQMVAWTLDPLLDGLDDPGDLTSVTVVDPACGAGSFLLGALRRLLDAQLAGCTARGQVSRSRRAGLIARDPSGDYRLTYARRAEILSSCIYGVDLDDRALSAARRALLLETYRGELDAGAPGGQLAIFRAPAPALDASLAGADALVGPDLPDGAAAEPPPLDWEGRFAGVFEREPAGFDAVLGNPPYVLLQNREDDERADYLRERYRSASYKVDLYPLFFELSARIVRDGGRVGLITPSTYLMNRHARALRELLLEQFGVEVVALPGYDVFDGVSVDTAITVLRRDDGATEAGQEVSVRRAASSDAPFEEAVCFPQRLWAAGGGELTFDVSADLRSRSVLDAIEAAGVPLAEIADAYFGLQTHDRDRWVTDDPDAPDRRQEWRPAVDGGHINRYRLEASTEWVCVESDAIKSGGRRDVHERDRIGVRQIGRRPIAALVPAGRWTLNTVYNVYPRSADCPYDLEYLLALISSELLGYFWEQRFFDQKRTFPKVKKDPLLALPIAPVDFDDEDSVARHDEIVAMADRMIELRGALAAAADAVSYDELMAEIRELDRELDAAIFALYGLDDDQIAAVRG